MKPFPLSLSLIPLGERSPQQQHQNQHEKGAVRLAAGAALKSDINDNGIITANGCLRNQTAL
jgi:hypothetical protein